jgi:transcriptional regulator with XRE-family HTH domain
MTQPQAGPAPELGARLRELRTESEATQKEVAAALGLGVSSISMYEKGAVPPDARLADYASFFAARQVRGDDRSPAGGQPAASQRIQKELLDELLALRPRREADVEPLPVKDLWTFAPGEPIMLVVGELEDMNHPYSAEAHRNYTEALRFADLDALVELHGHIRARNPDSDVRFIRADQLTASDNMTRHLVMLGGPGLNPRLQQILGRTPLPIRQTKHPDVEDGEVFVVLGQEPALPEFTEDEDPLLTEDVGLFARLTNPLTSTRTLTWCSGIFARGVLGAVRLLTDASLRDQNAAYLTQRFAAATQFAILARVPVLLGETITPDLQNDDARLYEWSDAEPRQPGEARPDGDARKATSR